MIWQDFVFSAANIVFIISLLPTVLSKDSKPKSLTSILTATMLAVCVPAQLTLHLWFAASTAFITAGLWFVLFWQVHSKGKLRLFGMQRDWRG